MKSSEMTYLVLGIVIGIIITTTVKQNDNCAQVTAAAIAAVQANTPPPPPPVQVQVPVPVPVPCPPATPQTAPSGAGAAQSGPDAYPNPPTPYVVPYIKNPGKRDCSRVAEDKVVIRASEVRALQPEVWQKYKAQCCYPDDRPDMQRDAMKAWNGVAGVEHYALLSYLANHFGRKDGAMFGELGSKEGASAMAMGVNPKVTVYAFDVVPVVDHVAHVMGSRMGRGVSAAEVQAAMPNIHFIKANLSDSTQEKNAYWRKLLVGSRVLLMDTLHFPETNPFEYEMIQYLDEQGFGGILLLDDLNLSGEMKRFWNFCKEKFGDRAHDVTGIGHGTGTGLIDFCGNTEIVWD
eukprot:TRINITY_DN2573_c0_g1_i1.p2 TRINITY_DN2573_c0_g1~~TRINITY_DN2573_c0_g1_i1.p2  ORF type:complete len:348 (+),score=125.96 TRINITY_DN2573_c0_g1_i1:51-1094(+)